MSMEDPGQAWAAVVAEHDAVMREVADPARLASLRSSGLLDSPPEESFDRLTRLAARLLGAPIAAVSLVDEDRQFFKSAVGFDEPLATARQNSLDYSYCQYVVAENGPLVVEDAREHPVLRDNRSTRELDIAAYAGFPLTGDSGYPLGSFCVLDTEPRRWTEDELTLLHDLAAAAQGEIALRLALRDLARERDLAQQIMATMGEGLAITDGAGTLSYINPTYARMLGYEPAALIGTPTEELIDPADRAALRDLRARRARDGQASCELRHRRRDGSSLCALVTAVPHPHGEGAISVVTDLTERLQLEEAIRETEQRLISHVENSPVAAVECSPDLRILRWSPGAERTFGWPAEEVIGRRVDIDFALIHPDDRERTARVVERLLHGRDERNVFYNRNLTRDGRVIHSEWHNSVLRDDEGTVVSIFSLALDVTAQVQLREELAHQALHDPLTGLANRASFEARARQILAADQGLAILFIDLDGFKEVNDRFGHAAGDELLAAIAGRLARSVRAGDVVLRFGGDEFVVLMARAQDEAQACLLADRLNAVIGQPILLAGREFSPRASIGIALSEPGADEPEPLLLAADAAMYRAKRRGGAAVAAAQPPGEPAAVGEEAPAGSLVARR